MKELTVMQESMAIVLATWGDIHVITALFERPLDCYVILGSIVSAWVPITLTVPLIDELECCYDNRHRQVFRD